MHLIAGTLLVLTLGGCGTTATPPAPPEKTVENRGVGEPPPVSGSSANAPRIEFRDSEETDFGFELVVTGAPAISADSRRVAVAHVRGDSDRGYPNLEIRILDVATDTVARVHPILTIEEMEAADQDVDNTEMELLRARVADRIAATNKTLAALPWRAMTHAEAENTTEPPSTQTIVAGDTRVIYARPNLSIERANVVVVARAVPLSVEGNTQCPVAEVIASLHVDDDAVLVRVIYLVGHHCKSEPDRYHVFSIARP